MALITANVDELLKSLELYHADTVRRLENMVSGFSYEVSLTAVKNTPLGDVETYLDLYVRRNKAHPEFDISAGLAQGNWQVSLDGTIEFQNIYSGKTALGAVKTHLMNYKLGETVLIGNNLLYIGRLEGGSSNQAPDGIMQPTVDNIMSTYKINLVRYFKE